MFNPFKKKTDFNEQLAKNEQQINKDEIFLRQPNEAEQDALFREEKQRIGVNINYRMWQQEWTDKRIMNIEELAGVMINKQGSMKYDTLRSPLCTVKASFHLNHFMAHQDRNLMASNFENSSDRNRYMKQNISMPIINSIFEKYEEWEITDENYRDIVINTTNPIDNGSRRALGRGEHRTDTQIIKTHEISNPNNVQEKQHFWER